MNHRSLLLDHELHLHAHQLLHHPHLRRLFIHFVHDARHQVGLREAEARVRAVCSSSLQYCDTLRMYERFINAANLEEDEDEEMEETAT